MPFDPTQKTGYSSNGGIAYQNGKWYRTSDGAETDEDGNQLRPAPAPVAEEAAGALAAAAEKTPDEPGEKVSDETDEDFEYQARLDALEGTSVQKLKRGAKNVMAALDEDGVEYEKPRMAGPGVGQVLKEFIAQFTG